LVDGDNSLSNKGKDSIRADIYLQESVIFFDQKDTVNSLRYVNEAYRLSPEKTYYILDHTPELKELKDLFVAGIMTQVAKKLDK